MRLPYKWDGGSKKKGFCRLGAGIRFFNPFDIHEKDEKTNYQRMEEILFGSINKLLGTKKFDHVHIYVPKGDKYDNGASYGRIKDTLQRNKYSNNVIVDGIDVGPYWFTSELLNLMVYDFNNRHLTHLLLISPEHQDCINADTIDAMLAANINGALAVHLAPDYMDERIEFGEIDNFLMLWSVVALLLVGAFNHPVFEVNLREAINFEVPYFGGEAILTVKKLIDSLGGQPFLKILKASGRHINALPIIREALKLLWKRRTNDNAAKMIGGWPVIQNALMN